MDLIIDASAIIAVVTNQSEKRSLVLATENAKLIAPASIHFEIGNAFSAMLKQGRISIEQSLVALDLYDAIPIRLVDIELDLSLGIASQLGICAYDAYLIRCAEKYHAPLLTLDRALLVHARNYGVPVMEIKS